MKVYGNVRLASVSGKGKTYSALNINKYEKKKNDCRILLVSNEKERK